MLLLCPLRPQFVAACRVWDIRTKVQVHCLSGHEDTVSAILAMPTDPQVGWASGGQGPEWAPACARQALLGACVAMQHLSGTSYLKPLHTYAPFHAARPTTQVITASHDKTVRLWDLRMGKTLATLTHHKKVGGDRVGQLHEVLVAALTAHVACSAQGCYWSVQLSTPCCLCRLR